MKKNQDAGIPKADLSMMTEAQREAMQRNLEKDRLETVKGIENVLSELSKKKKGKSFAMKNPKKLGKRPNDTVEK